MSTVMRMHWPEVTKDEYERARKDVNWEGQTPVGAKFHVAWFDETGLNVLDLWDSPQDFQNFVDKRLMPAVQRIGIKGQPQVSLAQSHAIFAPNV
jgi:uncharacterized protein YcfL